MTVKNYRLRELDFLRGVAIILVLLRHQALFQFTKRMGWIGVDLFFVLSGFLVSGLLFKEYLKYGNIKPIRFLIRRGFKIYPVYYIFFLVYIIPIIMKGDVDFYGIISDLTFIQNYTFGFGYTNFATWSLAVEEHFYFGLAAALFFIFKKNLIQLKVENEDSGISQFEKMIFIIMGLCLSLRIISNLISPEQFIRHLTMTHLRIDSLLAGVFVSYLYYFRFNYLKSIFLKYKPLLFVIAIAGVSWTPFIIFKQSFFALTIGFTLLYISFSILLVTFLLVKNINQILNSLFSKALVSLFQKIGFCSYSIYIIHVFVTESIAIIRPYYKLLINNYICFLVVAFFSVCSGMIITYTIERYFLTIRDKYFPNRLSENIK